MNPCKHILNVDGKTIILNGKEAFVRYLLDNPESEKLLEPGESGTGFKKEASVLPPIFRHAESEANVKGIEATPNTPLTEGGREQSRELGNHLRSQGITTIAHSTYERSYETAKEAAKAIPGAKTKAIPGIEEQKQGESDADFIGRVKKAIPRLMALEPSTAVISHGLFMKAMDALNETGGDVDEAVKIYEKQKTNPETDYANTEQLKQGGNYATQKSEKQVEEGSQQGGVTEHPGAGTPRQEKTQPQTDNSNQRKGGEGEVKMVDGYKSENGKFTLRFKSGELVAVDNKSGREASKKVTKKIVNEALSTVDFDRGNYAPEPSHPLANEEEAFNYVIENSRNPLEIASIYPHLPESKTALSEKESFISENGIGFITRKSFDRFSDPNIRKEDIDQIRYFRSKSGGGRTVDQVAKELSDKSGQDITPKDVVDFISRFPKGVKSATNELSELRKSASNKFMELTGLPLDDETAKIITNNAPLAKERAANLMSNDYWGKYLPEQALTPRQQKEYENKGMGIPPEPAAAEPGKVLFYSPKTIENENEQKGQEGSHEAQGQTQGTGTPGTQGIPQEHGVVPPDQGSAAIGTVGGGGTPFVTGLRKAVTAAEAALRGQQVVEDYIIRDLGGTVLKEAKEDFNNGKSPVLINMLKANPDRALNDREVALLTLHQAGLHNLKNEAKTGFEKAKKAGDDEEMAARQSDLDHIDEQLNDLHDVVRNNRRSTARGLRAFQLMIDNHYSQASVLFDIEREYKNKEVPQTVKDKLKRLSDNYEAAKENYKNVIQKLKDKNASLTLQRIKREVKAAGRKQAFKDLSDEREDILKNIRAIARKQAAMISANPIPVEMIPEIGRLAKNLVKTGVTELGDLVDKMQDVLRDVVPNATKDHIRDAFSGYGGEGKRNITRDETVKKIASLKAEGRKIAELNDKITTLEELKKSGIGKITLKRKERIVKSSAEVDRLKRDLAEKMIEYGVKYDDKQPIDKLQRAVNAQLGDYNKLLEQGQYKTPGDHLFVNDPDWIKAQGRLRNAEKSLDQLRKEAKEKNASVAEKMRDGLMMWRRAELLSSYLVIAKLSAAALYRVALSPLEQIVATGLNKIPGLSEVAKKAPRFGGNINVKAEIKALSTLWNPETWRQVGKVFHTGNTDLDAIFSLKTPPPQHLLDKIGHIHKMIKTPVMLAEYNRSMEMRLLHAKRNGINIDDPGVQLMIADRAYMDSQRAIFQQDTRLASLVNTVAAQFKGTKNEAAMKLVGNAMNYFMPITKVPTNIVLESLSYNIGGLPAIIQLSSCAFRAMNMDEVLGGHRVNWSVFGKGEGIKEEEAEYIMRNLTKQVVGIGAYAIGWTLGSAVSGGMWVPGRKKGEDEVPYNELKIFNTDVPYYLLESPFLYNMQAGATSRYIFDKMAGKAMMNDKDFNSGEAKLSAGAQSTLSLFSEAPFINFPEELDRILHQDNGLKVFLGQNLNELITPQLLRSLATEIDRDEQGNKIKRKPQTVMQGFEMGIPGLRKNVPVKGGGY